MIPKDILAAAEKIRKNRELSISRSAREILAQLILHLNIDRFRDGDTVVWPSRSALCLALDLSPRTVSSALKELSQEGLIRREEQTRRQKTGNFVAVRTVIVARTLRAAGLVGEASAVAARADSAPGGVQKMPPLYTEEQCQEKNNNTAQTTLHPDAIQPSASPKPGAPSHKPNCRKGFSFVSVGKTVPDDLLWLLERGVRPETVWTWMKRLRKSGKETLSQIVARFSIKIAAASNPGGYLNWLITSIERGENIHSPRPHLTTAVSTPDPVARQRQIDEIERARKQHKGRKYSSSDGKIYEVHEENVLCFIGGDPIPRGQISLSRFVEIYSHGALAEIEETPASSSPELKKAMNIIRMTKSGMFACRGAAREARA